MAEHADSVTHQHGQMPIRDHAMTYTGVMGLFKWGALGVADLLIFLTFWFCTPAGFFAALVVSGIVLLAGVAFLGRKKTPGH
jgi:predicted membrane channel-forming protein YqfA (hemolysin III family)